MADGFALAELVEVGLDVGGRDGEVLVEEAEEVGLALRLSGGGVGVGGLGCGLVRDFLDGKKFDAIAGGEDETFANARLMEESAGGVGEAFDRDGEAFANFDGGSVVVDAKEDEAARSGVVCAHGAVNLCTAENWFAAQTASTTRKTKLER
jgi:hypothetical protein